MAVGYFDQRSARVWLIASFVLVVACSLISLCLYRLDEPFSFVQTLRALPASVFTKTAGQQSRLNSLFPLGDTEYNDFWPDVNNLHMRKLIECLENNTCSTNETKIVIFASWDFTFAIQGHVSGENIWANSIMDSLSELGYSFFFAFNHHQLAERYRMFPELVKVVIAQSPLVHDCLASPECIKSRDNPLGVPLWKLFGFEFWRDAYRPHPLGKAWTLSPANYGNGNLFLGYSVNRTCALQPFIPHSERKNQVFVLAKRLSYFYHASDYHWPNIDYAHPPASLPNLTFVGSIWNDTAHEPGHKVPLSPQVPDGIINLSETNLPVDEFFHAVGSSKLLLGIGNPPLSPSPYDALCLGVPFLNPVWSWDSKNPDNRSEWATQHDGLKFVPEPYVYHVLKDRDTSVRARSFWEAVERAVNNPIDSYMPEDMTPAAVTSRVSAFVEADWRTKAEQLMRESKEKGKNLIGFTL